MVLGTEQVGSISEDDITTMFETNVLGLISLTQFFVNGQSTVLRRRAPLYIVLTLDHVPHTAFKKQNSGHIINLGSIGALARLPVSGLGLA